MVISAEDASHIQDINPDRIRYEMTPDGNVAHLVKLWDSSKGHREAWELVVSLNIVKTQVKSFYRKLNANNRKEARAMAQQFRLL